MNCPAVTFVQSTECRTAKTAHDVKEETMHETEFIDFMKELILAPDSAIKKAHMERAVGMIEKKDAEIAEQVRLAKLLHDDLRGEIAYNQGCYDDEAGEWRLEEQDLRKKIALLIEALISIKVWCEGTTCEICGEKKMTDTDCYDYVVKVLKDSEEETNRHMTEIDELRKLLSDAAPFICSNLCPSVKRAGAEWIHVDLCKRITNVIRAGGVSSA
jgi:hypothetical protein